MFSDLFKKKKVIQPVEVQKPLVDTKEYFAGNPKYTPEFESNVHTTKNMMGIELPLVFYSTSPTSYHTSRILAASGQDIYSSCGITPELQTAITDEIIKCVNNKDLAGIAVWTNNLKTRMKYPVDEDACIRMAAILYFIEGEDPNTCEDHWTKKKVEYIKSDPEAYSFFLPIGLINTPAYSEYYDSISTTDLQQRKATIERLTPVRQQSK